MSGPVDVAATSAYLHRVMNRCADAAFVSETTCDDIAAPRGVTLTLRGDGRRLLDGAVRFDPALPATDVAALFERVVTLGDQSLRVLLRAPADHPWSRFGPTRVTLAFPVRPNTTTPVSEARIVFPDQVTSPTGQVIGMPLANADVAPIDIVARTAEGGPISALAAVIGPPEPGAVLHSSGVRWCDDLARVFGGQNHHGLRFGMPPTFLPVASDGSGDSDAATWGFVWDRPDQPIDDGLLFWISPGGRFVFDDVRATTRHLTAALERGGRTHSADSAVRATAWVAALAETPDERHRESDAVVDGKISRRGIVDVDDGEQWLGLANGDAIRVPVESVAPARPFSGSLIAGIQELARQELADGFAGSAYRTAYEVLIAATRRRTAFEMHAAYAAMIAPLRALGRDVIADRCAAIISAATPMCHEVEGMEWSSSRTKELVAYDVRGLVEPGSQLRIDVDGATVVIDTMAMRPLRLSSLPAGTALELFESGTIEPAPGGGFISRNGKPVIGAVVDGRLVVGSVWDLTTGTGVSVEAVVDWAD